MTTFNETFDITIKRETGGVPVAALDAFMHLGVSQRSPFKVAKYANIDEVASVYATTDPEYIAANTFFSSDPRPNAIRIGSRAGTVTITPTAVNNFDYTFTITLDSVVTNISFTSDSDATEAEITAALQTQIDAISGITATDNTTDVSYVVDAAGAVAGITNVSENLAITFTPTETITDALTRCLDPSVGGDSTIYAFSIHSRAEADQLLAASFVASRRMLFFYQTSDPDALLSGNNDIGEQLQALNNARAFGIYYPTDTVYADAAAAADLVARTPGSMTLKWKPLEEVPVTNLSSTAISNLETKNLNYYIRFENSKNILSQGVTASGEFVYVIRNLDYVQYNMQLALLDLVTSVDIVGIDAGGKTQLQSVFGAQLQQAVTLGIAVNNENVFLNIPDPSELSVADRKAGRWTGITFGFDVKFAVHFVKAEGKATV